MTEPRFKVGDRVIVSDRFGHLSSDAWAEPGTRLIVTKVRSIVPLYDLREDGPLDRQVSGYAEGWFDPAPERAPRPTINFALDRYATARLYARGARSKALRVASHNDILQSVANGEEVDALALNDALASAFSAAATRYGQSLARREATKEIRHLHHIVQAVLANAIDGLPAYEQGERSRLVEELQEQNESKTRWIARAKAREDRRVAEIESLKDGVATATSALDAQTEEVRNLTRDREALEARIDSLEKERDINLRALTYARSRMTTSQQQRLGGFLDALREEGGSVTVRAGSISIPGMEIDANSISILP